MIQVKELKLAREKFLLLGPPVVVFAKNKMTRKTKYASPVCKKVIYIFSNSTERFSKNGPLSFFIVNHTLMVTDQVADRDCELGEWSYWSRCTCRNTERSKRRKRIRRQKNNGKECMGPLEITEQCDPDYCPGLVL